MDQNPPKSNGITTTTEDGPSCIVTSDGRHLFYRYRVTREDRWVLLRGPEGSGQWANFGRIDMGRPEEWCRDPDGTERRCSHVAEMLKNDKPQRRGFWRRLMGAP